MNTATTTASITRDLDDLARRAADKADSAIDSAQRFTHGALDTLQDKVHAVRDQTPGAISRAAHQVDELTRRGLEAARSAKSSVQDQAHRAGDRTVGYIKNDPVKSILIAAAAGAALVALVSMLTRSHGSSRN